MTDKKTILDEIPCKETIGCDGIQKKFCTMGDSAQYKCNKCFEYIRFVDNAEMILSILLAEKGINFIPMITITDPNISKLENTYLNDEWPAKGQT